MDIAQMPPGDYILYLNELKRELFYYNLETRETGRMLHSETELAFMSAGARGSELTVWAILVQGGDVPRNRGYLINLEEQSVLWVEDLCADHFELSKTGEFLGAYCYAENIRDLGHYEIIDTHTGEAWTLMIEVSDDVDVTRQRLRWIDEKLFSTHIFNDEAPCLVDAQDGLVGCADDLKRAGIMSLSNSKEWLALKAGRTVATNSVYPISCFIKRWDCEAVAALKEPPLSSWDTFGWMGFSPDDAWLGVVAPNHLIDRTTIGVYDTTSWTPKVFTVLTGSYLYFAWCPQGDCIIARDNSGMRMSILIYFNGRVVTLPEGYTMAVFTIPEQP
jgi:hypothetical protein